MGEEIFLFLPSLTFKRWSCQSNKYDQRLAMGVSCSGSQYFLVVLTNFTHFSLSLGVLCFVLRCMRHPEDVSSEQLNAAFRDLAVAMVANHHVETNFLLTSLLASLLLHPPLACSSILYFGPQSSQKLEGLFHSELG